MATRHQPTDDTRRIVQRAVGFGLRQEDISRIMGVDKTTLRKHYKAELADGLPMAINTVAQSLYNMATTGKNVTAMIFFLKCRGGNAWREKENLAPPPVAPEGFDVKQYSLAQLVVIERFLANPAAVSQEVRRIESAPAPAGSGGDRA